MRNPEQRPDAGACAMLYRQGVFDLALNLEYKLLFVCYLVSYIVNVVDLVTNIIY